MPARLESGRVGNAPQKRRVRRSAPRPSAGGTSTRIGPPAPGRPRPGPFPKGRAPAPKVPKGASPKAKRERKRVVRFKKELKRAERRANMQATLDWIRSGQEAKRAGYTGGPRRVRGGRVELWFPSRDHDPSRPVKRLGEGGVWLPVREAKKETKKLDVKISSAAENERKAIAPALKVLEQTNRPIHAIAGGTRAAIRGENVLKAAKRGVTLKDKYLFSDVLKEAGAPKWLAAPVGFGLDVVADPLTHGYARGVNVAVEAADKAGKKAYKQARKSGVPEKQARKAGQKAAKAAYRKAPDRKGVQIRFAGKGTSGRASAKALEGPRKATRRVREHPVVQRAGSDLSPRFRPKGVTDREFDAVRGAAREQRATVTRGRFRAVQVAQGLKGKIPPEDFSRVVNAIERGTVYDLPKNLREPAEAVERLFRQQRRKELKAGLEVGNRRNYFAHQLKEALEDTKPKRGGGGGPTRTVKPEFSKGRKHQGTIQSLKDEGIEFSEDVPLVLANRLSRGSVNVAKARFNKALLDAGRKVQPGKAVEGFREGTDTFVRLQNGELDLLSPADFAKLKPDAPGKYAVVSKGLVDKAYNVVPGGDRNSVTRAFDKAQGTFKYVATMPNPGFHMRNLYGDIQNAYLAEALPSLIKNTGTSVRTLKALGREEEALRKLGKHVDLKGKVKVKDHLGATRNLTYRELALEAEAAGAIRAGFFARELPELLKDAEKGVKKTRSGAGRRIGRAVQNREDVMRLATYIGGRKKGMTPRDAADRAARFHFDYGDLTPFERQFMRRLMPFYTFTRKNIPLQAKTLVTKPGKYANVEKLRQEMARAIGLDEDWETKLREYQQRGVPFPVKWKGQVIPLQPMLPLTDLNQVAIPGISTKSLWTSIDEQMKKAVQTTTPWAKIPIELYANYSFFFRGDIESDDSPLVAAPSWVGELPASVKNKIGVVPDYIDKRTGKKTWGWPAKVDYVAKQPPGPFNFFMQVTTPGTNRRGQGAEAKVFSYLSGIKADPLDKEAVIGTGLEHLYKEREELTKKRNALGQRGIGSSEGGRRETPEYRKIRDRLKKLDQRIYRLKKARGDKILPETGKPPSLDQQIEDAISGGGDVDAKIERALKGGGDVDKRIAEALGE